MYKIESGPSKKQAKIECAKTTIVRLMDSHRDIYDFFVSIKPLKSDSVLEDLQPFKRVKTEVADVNSVLNVSTASTIL